LLQSGVLHRVLMGTFLLLWKVDVTIIGLVCQDFLNFYFRETV